MTGRPNILIILADQLSWKALPVYGNEHCPTPNIDRIAARGAAFSQCYTPSPLCMPARPAIWSGRFPHETGIVSNGREFPAPPFPEHLPTMGTLFDEAGYRAVHFGKQHDSGSLRGFEIEPQKELPVESSPEYPLNYDTKQDRWTTTKIVEFLKNHAGPPFLAVADLNNPHNICGWVGENAGEKGNQHNGGPLPPLPDNFKDADFEKRPLPVQYICCSHRRQSQAAPWHETGYRRYLDAYYHYVQRLDGEVGLILDALESRVDAKNTLIVFMADHGDGMAAHQKITKQVSLYDETTRVPLIFSGPGVRDGGRVIGTPLVSSLDLLPTLTDYAGIPCPEGLWGTGLLPWLKGERSGSPHGYVASEWHTEWGFTIEPGRMIRTPRYKYMHYLEQPGEELYDLQNDPGETRTLIDDPARADALEEHRELLRRHVESTADDYFNLPWRADPRWRSHPPGYDNHTGPSAPAAGGVK